MLKTLGYGVSTASVLLLAVPSWKSATEQPILFLFLLAGIATAILGMFLRWLSFLREQKAKALAARPTATSDAPRRDGRAAAQSLLRSGDSAGSL